MSNGFYNFIIEDLSSGLTCVSVNHVIHFCTLNREFFNIDVKQPGDKKIITCYDIFYNKFINIRVADIEYCQILTADDVIKNNEIILDLVQFCKSIVADLQLTTDKSTDEIYNIILDSTFIDFNNVQVAKKYINFLKAFNLSIPNESIKCNEIADMYKPGIINAFKLLIQSKIDENNLELDELIKESEEQDDINDINSIKEMFQDVISQIDTDIKINNSDDLLKLLTDQWPPLLLPLPDTILNIQNDINDIFTVDADLLIQKQINDIILNITDTSELKVFLDELQTYDLENSNTSYCINKIIDRIDYLQTVEQ
mgnify:CR=1 FL=1